VYTISTGNLVGTTATVRFGRSQTLRVKLESTAPPVGTIVSWNPSTGELAVDLSEALIDEIGPGIWWYEVTVTRTSSGRRMFGSSGTLQVLESLPD
jgi:hypothetical protein